MELRVHLKVCEGCGCLWYRSQLDAGVYCASCAWRFREFPTPLSRKRRGRPRKLTLPTVLAVEDYAWQSADGGNTRFSTVSSCSGASPRPAAHLRPRSPGKPSRSLPPRKPIARALSLDSNLTPIVSSILRDGAILRDGGSR